MFPSIWNGSVDDTTRIALASSHDGKTWHWVPGGDLLRTSPSASGTAVASGPRPT